MFAFVSLFAATIPVATSLQFQRRDTPAVSCTNATTPTQIRIAYGGPGKMAVSWNTNQKISAPTVAYGLQMSSLTLSASSNISNTYATSSTYSNHVMLSGLQPSTLYYYVPQCGNANSPLSFTTARIAGDGKPYTFAMVGDMGTFGPDGLSTTVGTGAANPLKVGENTTIQALQSVYPTYDFIWHVGDIAYADAWLKEETGGYLPMSSSFAAGAAVYDRILNDFYVEAQPLSQSKPYMVLPGNHEANCDNGSAKNGTITYNATSCLPGQSNFTGYRNHWNMPSASSGGLENFWYSWDHGMVHFISFNTETDYPNAADEPGGEGAENAGPFATNGTQLAWLEKDLKSVDRTKTPWIIVSGHRPWYVSTTPCPECQSAFEPLFDKYGVDVVLHGHKHFYERQAPVKAGPTVNGTADSHELNNPSSPWYIVNGAAGHYDGLDVAITPYVNTSRKVIDTVYGWSKFEVHNCTHLTQSFVASRNGTVLDTATLFKNRTCNFTVNAASSTGGNSSTGVNSNSAYNVPALSVFGIIAPMIMAAAMML